MGNASSGRIQNAGVTYNIKTQSKPQYNKVEYRTPGTFTFTVPANITTLRIEVAGAGGGSGYPSLAGNYGAGGKGEGIVETVSVNALQTYEIIVGAGGSTISYPANAYADSGGSSSAFGITARGGGGGHAGGGNYSSGVSYEGGAPGGGYGKPYAYGCAGEDGWVIIEYGGDI